MRNDSSCHIIIAGCPNAGKTALFNRLTGSHQKVANYAGVTVEYKQGTAHTPAGRMLHITDVPGAYSLTSSSPDERLAREVLRALPGANHPPDMMIVVADATNLALHLRFALELKTLGIPMILALNMTDIAAKQGLPVYPEALSQVLGVPVIPTIAVRTRGIEALLHALDHQLENPDHLRAQPHVTAPPQASSTAELHQQAQAILKQVGMKNGITPGSTHMIDRVLLHPVLGIMLLLAVMFCMFQAVFTLAEIPMNALDDALSALSRLASAHITHPLLRDFITSALIGGVGSVIIFLPQILIVFFFILLLEDSGYMARAAFLLDKLMGGAGLSGRAFIPLLSSFACAIPGIMATRTIASPHDRLVTMLIAPLMTCSARIPVYTLIIAAFIPSASIYGMNQQGLVMFALYALGLISGLVMARLFKRFVLSDPPAPFMMELPSYKLPSLRNLTMGLFERAKIFLTRAGTIIFAVSVILWALMQFPSPPEGSAGNPVLFSTVGIIGTLLAPLFAPIGFSWQIVVALIPGLAAREVAIAALGTVYAVSASESDTAGLAATLQADWSLPTALSFLIWYVFAPQCISTLAVLRRESSTRWMWFAFFYLLILAYVFSAITYHTARALLG